MKILVFIFFILVFILALTLIYIVVKSRQHKLKDHSNNLLGAIAITETDLDPLGLILIFGEAWRASAVVKIPKGIKVKVVAVEGVFLKVEPVSL